MFERYTERARRVIFFARYEASQFGEACQTLYPLLGQQEGKYDIPSLNLLTRAVEALKNPPSTFDGIYELSSK